MKAAAALLSALALVCCAASANAEAAVPVEGKWTGRTAAAMPVSFEVKEGQILDVRFRFKWGSCGVFESALEAELGMRLRTETRIDPNGHWEYSDSRGPEVEGIFVAPDRVEGAILVPGRTTPSCPGSKVTFQAVPGEVPPPAEDAGVLTVVNVDSGELDTRPHRMFKTEEFFTFYSETYFYALQWQSFGGPVARATGRARVVSRCCGGRLIRPRVTLRLTHPVRRGANRVYSRLSYVLRGPLPPDVARRGTLTPL